MSDNHKYYYIKLKDSYFDQDNVKVLESMKNGHIYSLILIKLYLRASKHDGKLMMTQTIPYEPNNIEVLASVLNHDVDHVKEAIRLGVKLDLIAIIDGREIWMTEIQNFIGQSSTEADRIRAYRAGLEEAKVKKLPDNKELVQMYDKSTPELETELELDIEIEKEIEKERRETTGSAEPHPSSERLPNVDYDLIYEYFNKHCSSLHSLKGKPSEKRKALIRKLLKDGYTYEDFEEVFKKAGSNKFLTGDNARGWKADFNWLLEPSEFQKILEGGRDRVETAEERHRREIREKIEQWRREEEELLRENG